MSNVQFGEFRGRLSRGDRLAGSFLKTPTVHATEILAGAGYDFIIIDQEHGPFDRGTIDLMLMAASAMRIAAIVRVSGRGDILAALDMGAAGVLVPHVNDPKQAAAIVADAHYIGGQRGCSPSPRAGRYGRLGLADHVARADQGVVVAAMIEHPDALGNIDAICAVDGIDAVFLGLGDYAVASGAMAADAPEVEQAARAVCAAAARHGIAVMATMGTVAGARWLFDLGVTALVIGSDQGLLRAEADRQLHFFRQYAEQSDH